MKYTAIKLKKIPRIHYSSYLDSRLGGKSLHASVRGDIQDRPTLVFGVNLVATLSQLQ